eukprot:CAMPEP_0198424576 /NCGR_PEP_ID=MMETSP1452-20131203/3960_1 /TAXON_ID=1181717 /ORGANISM="Synchroma pusillum, Strain CCMP3072" /LENGTH=42 /DNA_ID= /DNA_START= /DNA_END= /DNA_ORIENTATION=
MTSSREEDYATANRERAVLQELLRAVQADDAARLRYVEVKHG